jgi:hypothetical protein
VCVAAGPLGQAAQDLDRGRLAAAACAGLSFAVGLNRVLHDLSVEGVRQPLKHAVPYDHLMYMAPALFPPSMSILTCRPAEGLCVGLVLVWLVCAVMLLLLLSTLDWLCDSKRCAGLQRCVAPACCVVYD